MDTDEYACDIFMILILFWEISQHIIHLKVKSEKLNLYSNWKGLIIQYKKFCVATRNELQRNAKKQNKYANNS